jgi:hypothetical protein
MRTKLELAADHLNQQCRWLDLLLQRQIVRMRVLREQAPDKFRGLYIADAEVDELLAGTTDSEVAEQADRLGEQIRILQSAISASLDEAPDLPWSQLKTRFELSEFECQALFIALAPELDLRYQTFYAYVQNDVTRKAPTVDLILKLLCPTREEQWSGRRVVSESASLLRNCLLEFLAETQDGRPLLAKSLAVPQRIASFLLGHDLKQLDPLGRFTLIAPQIRVEDLILPATTKSALKAAAPRLRKGGVASLHGRGGSGKCHAAAGTCSEVDLNLVVCDLTRPGIETTKLVSLLRRECLLSGAGLYLKIDQPGSQEASKPSIFAELARELEDQPFPVFLGTEHAGGSAALSRPVIQFRFELVLPEIPARRVLWQRELNGSALSPDIESEVSVLAGKFRFTPGQIRDVVIEARNLALLRGPTVTGLTVADLYAAARIHGNPGLQRFAQKSGLLFSWEDLVLPERILQQLREVVNCVRFRDLVHGEWHFDSKVGKTAGVNVLFSGLSGTGKTMAASVLARELSLDLYKIDLSSVVSKYVGETEKNLSRVFDEAEYSSAVLFFDEADALFGKRSEVKDAHDRYANFEVAFLLQRIEQFSGLAILATNISRNIDPAFARRMQHTIEFPFPDIAHRERIWRAMFPPEAPLAPDVDFPFLARQFELSGGNIRNVVTGAAFLAAQNGRTISMEHLTRATGREYQKMGKLPSKSDFGDHFGVLSAMNDGGRA